ncbi:AAA family ATPase [uncultured Methanoregula sp.]|uniref:ATP-binding protein n=1 Tax=uncultured Methanoregula sp. TaxID=1005933 RepID=UPI002AAAE58A|nr:AAA family ATPase [uncultured Methanoregula sp.]
MSDTWAEREKILDTANKIQPDFYKGTENGIRIVITGKGGVGKTTITAILAHLFAQQGFRVLAIDGDPQQNLAVTLGIPPPVAEQIIPVSRSVEYLREKTGAVPGLSPGGLLTINPDVSDVVDRFSVDVAGNLRVLVMGGVRQAGSGCLCPEYTLLTAILRHMRLLKDDVILLDTPAGLEHFGRAVADGFTCAVVVADPSYNSLTVARESAALARQLGIGHIILVVNRVGRPEDRDKARERAGRLDEFSRVMLLSFDSGVLAAEPEVIPLLTTESEFMRAIKSLAVTISHKCEVQSPEFP